jgi:hypothetical protein
MARTATGPGTRKPQRTAVSSAKMLIAIFSGVPAPFSAPRLLWAVRTVALCS